MSGSKGRGPSRRAVLGGLGAGAAGLAGFPHISRGQGKEPIKVGMPTVLSGRFTVVGNTTRAAALLAIDAFNEAGGLDGRKIELVPRDDKARPDEAARVIRELINNDGCQLIIAASTTAGAFAIQEVVRETGHLCIHTVSETSALTADPKIRAPNSFRAARQVVHDAIAGAQYSAALAKERGLKRWMTNSPDFAYGRDATQQFVDNLKKFDPDVTVVGESWPKFMAPDYTESLTQLVSAKPDAVFTAHSGGDIVAFMDQARLYNIFAKVPMFTPNLADVTTLKEIKNLPPEIRSGSRYVPTYPATPANQAWYDAYVKKNNFQPSNWAWQTAAGTAFLLEAMRRTRSADGKVLAEALRGMTIDSPFGVGGKLTLRAEDQTLVNYAIGWGVAKAQPPYFTEIKDADWKTIYDHEAEWKRSKGFV